MKKKLSAAFLVAIMVIVMLSGCGNDKPEASSGVGAGASDAGVTQNDKHDTTPIKIAVLKGPTSMGMVKMMKASEEGTLDGHDYAFTLCSAVDEVSPMVIQGSVDMAAIPANMASVIYNKTEGGVKVVAVNTLGVLYIVENGDTVRSVSDLRGKTIYAAGQGATPEYALSYILENNGLTVGEDVNVEWKSEHAECLSALAENEDGIALLPQPFVTVAQSKNTTLRVALNLTEEWDKLQKDEKNPSMMITGVLVVQQSFADEHPEAVDDFLKHYNQSVDFTNNSAAEAAQLIDEYDIVPAAVAEKAIPDCNIVCITGKEMKAALSGYLKVLYDKNPQATGGAIPGDDFYYIG